LAPNHEQVDPPPDEPLEALEAHGMMLMTLMTTTTTMMMMFTTPPHHHHPL
jgi:hypothetical protein